MEGVKDFLISEGVRGVKDNAYFSLSEIVPKYFEMDENEFNDANEKYIKRIGSKKYISPQNFFKCLEKYKNNKIINRIHHRAQVPTIMGQISDRVIKNNVHNDITHLVRETHTPFIYAHGDISKHLGFTDNGEELIKVIEARCDEKKHYITVMEEGEKVYYLTKVGFNCVCLGVDLPKARQIKHEILSVNALLMELMGTRI